MAETTNSTNGIGDSFDEPELSAFVQQTDEARAVVQPANVGELWIEREYDEARKEQIAAHAEKAETKAAKPDATAAELSHEADKAEGVSNDLDARVTTEREQHETAKQVLGPHVRRPTDAKPTYWLTRLLILGGDIAGIGGAALLIGEDPVYAFMQATSAAVSAVTLGGVGRELRYLMAARIRQKPADELTEEEQRFASWFADPGVAERYVKIVALACATGIVLMAAGIFALRGVAEGFLPAMAFWGFAMALGLASFYNSFTNADEIAEHLDGQEKKVNKAEKKAKRVRQEPVIGRRAKATAEAASIRKSGELAGDAAAAGIGRALFHVLGSSPGVAGNGVRNPRGSSNGDNGKGPKRQSRRRQGS